MIKFSEIPTGTTFTGVVTSIRTGDEYSGIFAKVSGPTLLIETPGDGDSGNGFRPEAAFFEDPPKGRFIRPETVVVILTAFPSLAAGRVPILLDDLEVRHYVPVRVGLSILPNEEAQNDQAPAAEV